MLISVVIPTVRAKTLKSAIDSILAQTHEEFELIIVTQGTDPMLSSVVDATLKSDRRVSRVHLERCGISLARNAGVAAARGEVVAFTDDDCEAAKDWLAVTADCFREDPEIGLLGGALVEPTWKRKGICKCPSVNPMEVTYDPRSMSAPPEGWTWAGANIALRKSTLERVGPFDEYLGAGAIFPVGEETDVGFRLEALQIPVRCTPRSVVLHAFGHRYGLKAVMNNARNYAYGTGALAAKLTLKGNRAGQEWLENVRRQCLGERRPHRFPFSMLRLKNFTSGYRHCLREFRIGNDGTNLVPLRNS